MIKVQNDLLCSPRIQPIWKVDQKVQLYLCPCTKTNNQLVLVSTKGVLSIDHLLSMLLVKQINQKKNKLQIMHYNRSSKQKIPSIILKTKHNIYDILQERSQIIQASAKSSIHINQAKRQKLQIRTRQISIEVCKPRKTRF